MKRHPRTHNGVAIIWIEDHATDNPTVWYPYCFMFQYPVGKHAHRVWKALEQEVTDWCRDQFGPENFGEDEVRTWWHTGATFRIEGEHRAAAFKMRWL